MLWFCWWPSAAAAVKETKSAEEIIQHLCKKSRLCKMEMEDHVNEYREHNLEAIRFENERLTKIALSHTRIAQHAKKQAEIQQGKYENLIGLLRQLIAAKKNVEEVHLLQASVLTLEELLTKSGMPDPKTLMDKIQEQCAIVQEHTDALTRPLMKEEEVQEKEADFFLPDAPTTTTTTTNKSYEHLIL